MKIRIGGERLEELEALMQKHGCLTPQIVVEFARDPQTAIHQAFIWDDTEAANRYREVQAAKLIRYVLQITKPEGSGETRRVRAFVTTDLDPTSTYHRIEEVLADPTRRAALVQQAKREYWSFREKYSALKELAEFFRIADEEILKLSEPDRPQIQELQRRCELCHATTTGHICAACGHSRMAS
jgi:hypothetical protein